MDYSLRNLRKNPQIINTTIFNTITMQEGTVKFFNEAKGFGFISPADGGKDIFVHSSGLDTRSIRENDKVVFEVQKSDKGLNAVNVKLA